MIDAAAVFAGSLASALFLLTVALLRNRLTGMRDRLQRIRKRLVVTYRQTPDYDKQSYAMGAGIVVFFVWWSVAIVKGW
jgi:hypothetical protein